MEYGIDLADCWFSPTANGVTPSQSPDYVNSTCANSTAQENFNLSPQPQNGNGHGAFAFGGSNTPNQREFMVGDIDLDEPASG